MNFIEELYYGNLNPNVKSFESNSDFAKAMEVIASVETRLTEELQGEHKSLFIRLVDAQSEVNGVTAYESFLEGFLLGAALIRDTFLTDHDRVFRDIT